MIHFRLRDNGSSLYRHLSKIFHGDSRNKFRRPSRLGLLPVRQDRSAPAMRTHRRACIKGTPQTARNRI